MKTKKDAYNRLWNNEWQFLHKVGPSVRSRNRILLKLFQTHIKQGAVLDSGCGDGTFLQQLQQKYGASFTYEGADISEVALARVKNLRFVQATYTIDLENENLFIHKKYDAVVSSEVLEHIQNWKKALSHLLSLLKPQGLLFITVPHGMKYWSANDEFAHHYRRFEIGQIEEELAQQGYEVLERICWGFPLYWLYYTVLLNHTDPSKNMNSQYSLAKKRLSDFLYLLFHIDDLFNNSLGRRLFIVARKKAKPKTVAQA